MAIDGGALDQVPKAVRSLRRDLAVAVFASGAVEMVTRALTIILSIATVSLRGYRDRLRCGEGQ